MLLGLRVEELESSGGREEWLYTQVRDSHGGAVVGAVVSWCRMYGCSRTMAALEKQHHYCFPRQSGLSRRS